MSENRYQAVYRCVACKGRMTYGAKMNSGGICPHCGNISLGTIVDCRKTSEPVMSLWSKLKGIFK